MKSVGAMPTDRALIAGQLKGMTLAILDTWIIAAGLAAWAHTLRQPHAPDTTTIASAGLCVTLPLGALLGRIATTHTHHRVQVILAIALAMVVPCALIAWQTIPFDSTRLELVVLASAMWAPTSVLALALERWTRPAPLIPTCEVHKTLL